jgi:UDP-N-acetylglucosamine 1-carboxyvinyltransferase
MDKFVIQGGQKLSGEIAISGAKNAALPALAATLLTGEEVVLDRIPGVRDIRTMAKLLESTGAEVTRDGGSYRIRAAKITAPEAPYELVKTMRASSLVLGPLVARCGRGRVSLPGGCAIGARPINLHLAGLEKLGASVHQDHGYIEARAPQGLKGCEYQFARISVTGTEDLMMAAVLAEGETVLENAAREPEVADLGEMLNKMGAEVEGAGTSTIRIRGKAKLNGVRHAIIPDRIETGTYLMAAAAVGGELTLTGADVRHLGALVEKLVLAGAEIETPDPHTIRMKNGTPLRSVDVITQEYPGFPTDMQAQWMALMTQAKGVAHIIETIFENRFMHAAELMRMGANIHIEGNRADVKGKTQLTGATVMASDLRASAGLVIAALAAKGETVIDRVYHIDRGYERVEEKLAAVGARIRRQG